MGRKLVPVGDRSSSPLRWPIEVERRSHWERNHALVAGSVHVCAEPTISVIMTTYNSSAFVAAAVQSIQEQTYKKLEIVVVDDGSRDDTLEILRDIKKKDRRINVIASRLNRGTYFSKNIGIVNSHGSLITFMDSDDVSEGSRIEKQLLAMSGEGLVATTCNYVRHDSSGRKILNRGVFERPALISLMVKREVFCDVGYFDCVRASADAELFDRVRAVYGRKCMQNVAEPLYIAALRPRSLTTEPGHANNLDAIDIESFLSPPRLHYTRSYQAWHKAVLKAKRVPFMPFPPVGKRAFPVYGKMRIATGWRRVGLAWEALANRDQTWV